MFLVDWQIEHLSQKKELIAPYCHDLLNPASYDVRVGSNILIESENEWQKINLGDYSKENPYQLQPREFILLELLEYIKVPANIVSQFVLKSSRAREGYNHSLSAWIDPGYEGRLTLEIENMRRNVFLPIYEGLRIGQLVFSQSDYAERPYSVTGRYHGDISVQQSKG